MSIDICILLKVEYSFESIATIILMDERNSKYENERMNDQ